MLSIKDFEEMEELLLFIKQNIKINKKKGRYFYE